MIIGYNFFGLEEGTVWDTPVCTDMLDELQIGEGTYDEVFIDLNTSITNEPAKPTLWSLTTIMDSKFTGDLDAGSIGAEGFKVNKIQLQRSIAGTGKWDAIGLFDYNEEFNVYNYIDRYVQNGADYQYGIAPVANEIIGDRIVSTPITAQFEGIFITDKNENRRLEYDISLGDVAYNTNSALNQPINSPYPIVTFGQSRYRSGQLTVLPLSDETVALAGSGIDKLAEQINRQEWLDFLNNGRAKVLRMDSGVIMLVVTQNARVSHKQGDILRHLASISFDYTEIGDINFDMLTKNNLIPIGYGTTMTYDENGGIVIG